MKKSLLHSIVLGLIDVLLLVGVFYIAAYMRVNIDSSLAPLFGRFLFKDFSFVILIVFALMYYEKIYTLRYDFWQETYKVLRSLFLAYFIVLALLTLLKTSLDYSRLFISLYFMFTMMIMPIAKRYTKKILYSMSFFKKKVLVVGDSNQVEVLKKEFTANWYMGMECHDTNYDTVVISSKRMSIDEVNKKIAKYLDMKSSVYVVPYVTGINFASSTIMEYSNIRYNTIQIENKLFNKKNILIKSMFDMLVAFTTLPLFIILHLMITFAIKLNSTGAVFFKQHRLGKGDNDFVCYKYRTMYENSDKILEDYLQENPDEAQYYNEYHKYKNDPRITKVGKILRATSLDELAQLLNVIKGDMSLVGPRPYMLGESDKLGGKKHFILKVKPGITGLWQISRTRRPARDFQEWVYYDTEYTRKISFKTDMWISFKTAMKLINDFIDQF